MRPLLRMRSWTREAALRLAVFGLGLMSGESADAQALGGDRWHGQVTMYLWFSNVDGLASVGDLAIPVGDSTLGRNAALRLELSKGRLGMSLNLSRARRLARAVAKRADAPSVSVAGRYDFRWNTAEWLAAFRIGPVTAVQGVRLYGGLRFVYQNLGFDTSPDSSRSIEETQAWVEPVAGSRFLLVLGRRIWSAFAGDVGGFAVGSDFTWTISGEVGFVVTGRLHGSLRYTYQEVQYDNNEVDSDRYSWDRGVQQGWYLGLALQL